jgi:hypothetical protein
MIVFLKFLVMAVAGLAARAFEADVKQQPRDKTRKPVQPLLSQHLTDFASAEHPSAIADAHHYGLRRLRQPA